MHFTCIVLCSYSKSSIGESEVRPYRLLSVALGIQEETHCVCVCVCVCVRLCAYVFVCSCVVLWNDVIISTAMKCTSPKDSAQWITVMISCKIHGA